MDTDDDDDGDDDDDDGDDGFDDGDDALVDDDDGSSRFTYTGFTDHAANLSDNYHYHHGLITFIIIIMDWLLLRQILVSKVFSLSLSFNTGTQPRKNQLN